jgi:integrase/recombinase XerC
MNQVVSFGTAALGLPTIAAADLPAKRRFMEFFTANIRNPNTRKAYARAAGDFLLWSDGRGVTTLPAIQPMHVAA